MFCELALIYKRVLNISSCYHVVKHNLMNLILTGVVLVVVSNLCTLNFRMRYHHRCFQLLLLGCGAYSWLTVLSNAKTHFLFPRVHTFCVTFLSATFLDRLFFAFCFDISGFFTLCTVGATFSTDSICTGSSERLVRFKKETSFRPGAGEGKFSSSVKSWRC